MYTVQVPTVAQTRPRLPVTDPPEFPSFSLGSTNKSYKHQYANIYYTRLKTLRGAVEEAAALRWAKVPGKPKLVSRVLDVLKAQVCYVVGTVYMEMPLKPNVLEDIGKEHWLIAPPPRAKFNSPNDKFMLEDESGRVRLVGEVIEKKAQLVTGVIMGVLGLENSDGDFQVLDLCFPEMAPQKGLGTSSLQTTSGDAMDVDVQNEPQSSWVALVSGLDIGTVGPLGDAGDARFRLFVEYITGECGDVEDQTLSARISHLIIAGNSLIAPERTADDLKSSKRFANAGPAHTDAPMDTFTAGLSDLTRSLPVHILPGPTDPAGATLPQQSMPSAMFGKDVNHQGSQAFKSETNPAWIDIGGCHFLGTSGQPLDDIYKYVSDENRLEMARNTLRWRHMAPTAPDTLWCYPFFEEDPFVISQSPHVYFVGNQPEFKTDILKGEQGQCTRVILLPRFSQTGIIVLVNTASLEVKTLVLDLNLGEV
ncbi:hypothetical protein BOTBODRAFT_203638 [Botryobasidium botryosum FD-172 SS1]|uniref:DNA-directed DNA polymerase n=1 Tax=Botryobasidium botryosum (strain FD-172 SS1) TaxID=930990 RepID=A0A067N3B3_BOTB1|nr:hypothetical protein BOTBODRAFT_203638 [Botryobasidium botryosum FD-172 SS1]